MGIETIVFVFALIVGVLIWQGARKARLGNDRKQSPTDPTNHRT